MVIGSVAILLFFGRQANAGTVVFGAHTGPHAGIGVWIGTPDYHPPMHDRVIITRPWHHRPVYVMPPRHEVVVVPPPVIVQPPAPIIQQGTVDVWITNSNGSRTSVRLTREGPWYVGPRGEYYADMPTNEQLRVVYGF